MAAIGENDIAASNCVEGEAPLSGSVAITSICKMSKSTSSNSEWHQVDS